MSKPELASVRAAKLFPGRATLLAEEVAQVLSTSAKHVSSLIEEGFLEAIEITGRGNKTKRRHWRIPVSALDDYMRARSSLRNA